MPKITRHGGASNARAPQPVALDATGEPLEGGTVVAADGTENREVLLARAEAAGVKVNRRWGDVRLLAEVEAAEAALAAAG